MTLSPPGESTGTPGPSAAAGNRDSTGPARASRHRYRGPKPQVSGEAPAPRSRPAHMAGWRSPLGAGTPGWPHSSPQKHPRPLPTAGPRQEGVKLESRNSPLRASPGPPLPPPPQRKGPRAAAPAGRLSRAGRAPHPLPAPGHRRAPRTFPRPQASPGAPHLSGALCAFPWAFRIISRGTRSRSPARSTHASFPKTPAPPGPRAASRDIPHSLPSSEHPYPRTPALQPRPRAPPDTAPRGRTMRGWRGRGAPAARGVRNPRSGGAGVRDRGTPRGKGCAE